MDANKEKALDAALSQIERQFGKGTVMRMGDQERVAINLQFTLEHCLTGERAGKFPRTKLRPSHVHLGAHGCAMLNLKPDVQPAP